MKRRSFVILIGSASAWPLFAHGQQPGRTYRLGVLGIGARQDTAYLPFFAALRGLGFVEGQNLLVAFRASEGREHLHTRFAAEIVDMNPDAIVTFGSAATVAARSLTRSIPIIMAAVPNPERVGLVESLARPGGNVTGVSTMLIDLAAKIADISREIMPERKRMGVFWNSDSPSSAAARARRPLPGFTAIAYDVRSETDIEPAFAKLVAERADLLMPHAHVWSYRDRILELAAKHRIPVVFMFREWAAAGALFTYGPDLREQMRLAALCVAKILNGANPAEVPVQQATKFELLINLKTARTLGIAVPSALLTAADEVIE